MSVALVLRQLRQRWFGGLPRRGARRAPAARAARWTSTPRPAVEALEDRTLLSVLPPPMVTQQAVISINPNAGIGTGGLHNSPSIAVDPANPQNMVSVYATDLGNGISMIQGSFSTDGGADWLPITGPTQGCSQGASATCGPFVSNLPQVRNVISQLVTNPITGTDYLPQATDPTVAFDRAIAVDANGNIINHESFYVTYVEHLADNSVGAVMIEKYDFSTGFPKASPLTPNLTTENLVGGDGFWQQPGMLYTWAAADAAHSMPALNPVVMVDSNLPPIFTNPANPAGPKVSFVDPVTHATQADNLIVPLRSAGNGQPLLDANGLQIWQGEIYVAFNTNNVQYTNAPPFIPPHVGAFTPSNIRLMASTDGGQSFTTARFANENDAPLNGVYDPNFTQSGEADAAPRLVVSQGTSSDRTGSGGVAGGQATIVWDNFGGGNLQSNSVQGGTAAVFTSNNPANLDGTGSTITDAFPNPNGGPDIPQTTVFTTSVNIQNPNFTNATDLQVSLDIFHQNLDQLQINLLPEAKLAAARDLAFGPDGNIYITSHDNGSVVEYYGPGKTSPTGQLIEGQFARVFVPSNTGGLTDPEGLVWGSDGDLYVTGIDTQKAGEVFPAVFRYSVDPNTGNAVSDPSAAGTATVPGSALFTSDALPDPKLQTYTGLTFDASGTLYVGAFGPPSQPGFSGSDIVDFYGRNGAGPEGTPVPGPQGAGIFVRGTPGQSGGAVTGNGLSQPFGLAFGPDGELYVGNFGGSDVLRFKPQGTVGVSDPSPLVSGPTPLFPAANNAEYVPVAEQKLTQPTYIAFGADGDLYVSNSDNTQNQVVRFLGPLNYTGNAAGAGTVPAPGTFLDVFASSLPATWLTNSFAVPRGLAFQPTANGLGDLFVLGQVGANSTSEVDAVYRVTGAAGLPDPGKAANGTPLPGAQFNGAGGNLVQPHSIATHTSAGTSNDLDLLVTDTPSNDVQRYDGLSGAWLGTYVGPGLGGLQGPTGIAVDKNGNVFVSSSANSRVIEYSGVTQALFVKNYTPLGQVAQGITPETPTGLAFDTAGDLFIADFTRNRILRYDTNDAANPGANYTGTAIFVASGALDPNNNPGPQWQHPVGVAYDDVNQILYVSAQDMQGNPEILAFDSTGHSLAPTATNPAPTIFASKNNSPLTNPGDLWIDETDPNPDHHTLYVANAKDSTGAGTESVLRFTLHSTLGGHRPTDDRGAQYLESIVPYGPYQPGPNPPASHAGGLSGALGVTVNRNDGSILVVSQNNAKVMRYTGSPAFAVDKGNVVPATQGGGIFVQPGGAPVSIQLLHNHTQADGTTLTNVGINGGINLGIWPPVFPPPPTRLIENVGTTFDQFASEYINDPNAAAPYSEHFRPDPSFVGFGPFAGTVDLSWVFGQAASQIDSTWIIEITDFRSNRTNGVPPPQFLEGWDLSFTSGLTPNTVDRTIPAPPGTVPLAGNASEDGSTISVGGATVGTLPNAGAEAPNRGVGPTPAIAADNTLGSFSPYQGRIYVAYTGGSAANPDIYLTTSDDGGQTWLRTPIKVNDDSIFDGFSGGNRPQFDPSIAVDQTTGTLVLSFYDTRNDAAMARSALYVATSLDGGWQVLPGTTTPVPDFAPETYLNNSYLATDAITYQVKNQGPIADNANADSTYNFGDHQGLAVVDGTIYAAWAGDLNKANGSQNIYTTLHTLPDGALAGGATLADGPRAVSSTEGAVQALVANTDDGRSFPFNNTFAVDGTQQVNGFIVTFDRPVDASPVADPPPGGGPDPLAFTRDDVQVMFRDTATPAGTPPTPVTVTQVIPLDGYTSRYGPAQVGGVAADGLPLLSTRFLVLFSPSDGVGTYSYSVGPNVGDRIRSNVSSVNVGTPLVPVTQSITDTDPQGRIPHVDTGGDAANGAPQNDLTTSTIVVGSGSLAAPVAPGDTSIRLTSAAGFPSAGNFAVLIDAEQMLVTGGQGTTTWTVTRGINNTTPAAHTAGFTSLAAAVAPTDTTIAVASPGTFPLAGSFTVQIGGEELLVIGGQGTTTWTVVRGYNGTTAAAHAAGAAVNNLAVTMATQAQVTDISVTLNIQHTSDRDLIITLISPDGTPVVLARNEGGSGENYTGTTFSLHATQPISQGVAPFPGSYLSDESMNSFLGKSPNGAWHLVIDDTLQGDIGQLLSWTLNLSAGLGKNALQHGNAMDQNGNAIRGEAATADFGGDVYSVPTPTNNGPLFQPAYLGTTLPLIVPGPHIVSTFVPGTDAGGNVINPQTNDNLVLNQPVHFIDVTFDRDMDPNSFTTGTGPTGTSPGSTSLFQLLGPTGNIPLFDPNTGQPLPGVTVSPDTNPHYPRLIDGVMTTAADPDLLHPRTFRITLPDQPGQPAGTGLDLDGTYSLTIAPNPNASGPGQNPGPASAAGDLIDTNENAGLDLLRGAASDPLHARFTQVSHSTGTVNTVIPGSKGTIDVPLNFGPEDFLIQKATLQVNISAPNDPDLSAVLVSPDGKTQVPLFTQVGNNGTHQDFANTVFDDTASTPIQNGVAPFNSVQFGPFQPQTPLAQLDGLPSAGLWTLEITNAGPLGRDAVLHSWSLTLTEAIPGTDLGEPGADNADVRFRIFTQDPSNPLSHTVWTPVGPAAETTAVTPATTNATNSVPITHYSTAAPLQIAPGQTKDMTIDFRPENFPIQKLLPMVNIQVPSANDLTATLIAPDGTRVRLVDQPLSTAADFANTVFDDLGLSAIQGNASNDRAPFYSPLQGNFVPKDPMTVLLNKSSYGTWTLEVVNHSAADTATLNGWQLTLSEPIPSNSGQVNAMAVDPSDPSGNTVYIGAEGGGIWKTTDFLTANQSGPTWVPLTDFGPTASITISSIAVFGRNNDPRQSILFATTGNGGTGTPGEGVLRSMDGGATWTLLDSTNNTDSMLNATGNLTPINTPFNAATGTGRDHAFVGLTSYKVLVDPTPAPTSPTDVIVYACFGGGANGGLWRSLDSGRHWVLMSADSGQTATGTNCNDIVFAPATISVSTGNLQDVYAAFAGTGIYFSTNQGSNLRMISGGVGNTLIRDGDTSPAGPIGVNNEPNPNGATGRIVLAVPPLAHTIFKRDANGNVITPPQLDLQAEAQDPNNLLYEQWLYAAVVTPAGTLQGLYSTKDTGANWTQVQMPVLLGTGIANNNETLPSHDPTGPTTFPVPGGNGNQTLSLLVDPANPSVVYLGGLDNIGILETPKPLGGLIRVDTTLLEDAHNYTFGEANDPDGGTFEPGSDGSLVLKPGGTFKILEQVPDGSGNVKVITPPHNTPFLNLVTDPSNPFLRFKGNATILSSGVSAFTNDGDDSTYTPFIQAVNGPNGFEENGNLGVETMLAYTDPLTGLPRLLLGATTGVFTALDNNGQIVRSLGDTTDPSSTSGDALMANQSRNGNLQIAPLFDGTAQPSVSAAEVAAGVPGSGGLFYGNANNNGFPTSDPHTLDNGNLLWSGPLGSGSGVATDQTGTGNAYSFQWPGFGQYSALATTNFFVVNPTGSGYISRTGTGGTSLVQVNGGPLQPDPQWPFMSVNPTVPVPQFGGVNTPLNQPNSRFAVNPLNGDQIVISSEAGRIFRSRDQGRDWAPIADPAAPNTPASGGYSAALAYGAPDPNDPNHQLDDFIYAGNSAGHLWVTLDGGSHWNDITTGTGTGPDGSPILSISTNPIRGTHEAYIVTEKGVYHVTFNVAYPFSQPPVIGGVTWSSLTGNLFNIKSVFANFGQPDPNNGLLFQLPHDQSAANAATFAPEESKLQFLTSLAVDWRQVVGTNQNPNGPTLYVGGQGGVFRAVNPMTPGTSPTWTIFPAVAQDSSRVDGGYLPMSEVTDLSIVAGGINPANGLPVQATGPNVLLATTYGRGEFAIRLPNNDVFNVVEGPRIVSLSPTTAPNGTTSITVTFNEAVDPSTFTPSKVVSFTGPNGNVTVISVTDVSPTVAGQPSPHNVFKITFAPQMTVGTYTIGIGPNITDFAGHQMDQNGNFVNGEPGAAPTGDEFVGTFQILPVDANGLHVNSAVPDSTFVPPGMSSVTLTFNHSVDTTTFHSTDVSLTNPGNAAVTPLTLTDENPGTDSVWQVQFPTQTAVGNYTLTLDNTIRDTSGNYIDQSESNPNPTQPPVPPGAPGYTATFAVSALPAPPVPTPPAPIPTVPPGIVSSVAFTVGKPKKLRNGRYKLLVRVFNVGSQRVPEPLALIVSRLNRKIQLLNASGTTQSILPGNPFVAAVIPNEQLSSPQGATFTLLFRNPKGKKIKPGFTLVAGLDNP